jgi:hypothetical protein
LDAQVGGNPLRRARSMLSSRSKIFCHDSIIVCMMGTTLSSAKSAGLGTSAS